MNCPQQTMVINSPTDEAIAMFKNGFEGNKLIILPDTSTIEWIPLDPIRSWILQRIYYFNW